MLGIVIGIDIGSKVGDEVSFDVGTFVGDAVDVAVGIDVGDLVGARVGDAVGVNDGGYRAPLTLPRLTSKVCNFPKLIDPSPVAGSHPGAALYPWAQQSPD